MTTQERTQDEGTPLEEAVKRSLAGEGLGKGIYVVVKNGYVNLAGIVDQIEMKGRIGSWVAQLPGVRMVTNHLRVRSEKEPPEMAHF